MLRAVFLELIKHYTTDENCAAILWTELEKAYTKNDRFYHNLSHLESMFTAVLEVKNEIKNWNMVLFSLFYHDVIYDVSKNDNEAQSAEFAEKRMRKLNVSSEEIERCKHLILATKNHQKNSENDMAYFLDADLSVLGSPEEIYRKYAEKIRKEYSIFPNSIYNAGRINVLKRFLEMDRIYKTKYFFDQLEAKARQNISIEIKLLEEFT